MTNKADHDKTVDTSVEENVGRSVETAESDDLQAQLDKMKDQWLRAVAELENTRRRAQKEREDALKYAATNFSRDILSVYDSLSRAVEMVNQSGQISEDIKGFTEGVHLTLTELNNIFSRHGIQRLDPLNQPFDPNYHQAMFEVPTADVEPGIVVQVMQTGFTLHDRLLRPALVGVSKKPQ
ncbi:nucleotide exchange factor GrpE [Candidatus Odyssella thessalonicensis]|uniref:nucleotide exchange factor GrpE n=1 Tax=Candidatus Odyssella thessalonicensis TaxID=84647 RepID=UPI000225A97C|nr:nucleotide exchange factor GrpE [Candidatus Odyssella thessalonicensis]